MAQKIMTKYQIMVVEYDATGYYYPRYKTNQTIIAETLQDAKEKAIKRTEWKHNFGSGWVQRAEVIESEDIILDTSEL